MTPDHCDLCGSNSYDESYIPIGTRRGVIVCVCNRCGLVFSRQDETIPRDRTPRPSGDADWGNIRFAKGQRLDALKPLLQDRIKGAKRILDIGSNRGDFVRWARSMDPHVGITAIEPDERLRDFDPDVLNVDLRRERLENVRLEDDAYDFVFCCQTLEHLPSPSAALRQIHKTMRPGGTLFLEVPNLAVIEYEWNCEEFFIDRHSFHFDWNCLYALVKRAGFTLAEVNDDNLNARIVARKSEEFATGHPNHPSRSKQLIRNYEWNITRNRAALTKVVEKIHFLIGRGRRISFWGATTIFDLLTRYGSLDAGEHDFSLVDSYVWKYLPETHGVRVQPPEYLIEYKPDLIIVLARFSAPAIVEQAKKYGAKEVVTFEQLLRSCL